jgi:uncharacterized protein (DUF2062 family)
MTMTLPPNDKKSILQKILRGLKTLYLKIFRINDTPHKIAAGFALGVFLGILPATGIVAAIFLSILFKVNRASAIIGSVITNTWVTIPFFFMSVQIGAKLSHTTPESIKTSWDLLCRDFHWSALLESAAQKIFIPVILGYLLLSLLAGMIAYVIALFFSWYVQHKKQAK